MRSIIIIIEPMKYVYITVLYRYIKISILEVQTMLLPFTTASDIREERLLDVLLLMVPLGDTNIPLLMNLALGGI